MELAGQTAYAPIQGTRPQTRAFAMTDSPAGLAAWIIDKFWAWSDAAVAYAMGYGFLYTVFGWRIHVVRDSNPRSLSNFPMQANGAEMLRLGVILASEAGVALCAPIHDALLIEGAEADIDTAVAPTQPR